VIGRHDQLLLLLEQNSALHRAVMGKRKFAKRCIDTSPRASRGALKPILDRIFKLVSTGGTTSLPSVSPAGGHRKMSALKAISTDMTLPQAV